MHSFVVFLLHVALAVPFDETHLVVVRGLIHYEVLTNCVKDDSSTERRS